MSNERFLVDTSVWILVLRKNFIPKAKDRIDHLLKEDTIVTTGIVKLELLSGTRTEKEFRRLQNRLDALETIETDGPLWKDACDLGFKLRRKGITVPHTDILIGTCALKTDSTILHADAHFDMMAEHTRLKVESFVPALKNLKPQG